MKFRGVMIDAGPMREFTNIVTTISKLSKECVLRLSNDKLYFIVSEEHSGPAPPVLWCEIPQAVFFSEYQMIGIDEEHKDIYLGIISANLAKSLVTLKSAKTLKIKLTKKQCPCLTLEIEMLSIELPTLKQLRTTIDRMRTMAQEVVIQASAEGWLTLQIKTDIVKVCTWFKHLRVEAFEGPIEHSDSESESQVNEDMSKVCHCRVDAKKFSMFLSADQISHNRTICSIVHKKLVILCLHTQEDVKLQCFITGIVY
nr:checkpoint protein HUS1 isoform X2 [Maniola hyperantus]